jgi:hypothetical protein
MRTPQRRPMRCSPYGKILELHCIPSLAGRAFMLSMIAAFRLRQKNIHGWRAHAPAPTIRWTLRHYDRLWPSKAPWMPLLAPANFCKLSTTYWSV